MSETERVRERERPPLGDNPYERIMRQRKELAERNLTGPVVIRGEDRQWYQTRQGKLRYYLDPVTFKDTPLQHWRVFIHDIRTRSGKHRHQGGQVMMILEGQGYTLIDGVKHPWKAGDVVNLPLRADGIIVQHFNTDPAQPARFVAAEPNWLDCTSVDRGCGFEQLEDAPEYRKE